MDIVAFYESDLRRRQNKKRRERELKRNILWLIAALMLIVALSFAFGSILSVAKGGDDEASVKYYSSIELKYGETLTDIAMRYMDTQHYDSMDAYIKEVMKINHLKDDKIIAGQYIVVPYYAD